MPRDGVVPLGVGSSVSDGGGDAGDDDYGYGGGGYGDDNDDDDDLMEMFIIVYYGVDDDGDYDDDDDCYGGNDNDGDGWWLVVMMTTTTMMMIMIMVVTAMTMDTSTSLIIFYVSNNTTTPLPPEYHSCADVRDAGQKSDGHYWLKLSSRCVDSTRVYCHNVSSQEPREYITVPSAEDKNFARIFGRRLRDRYQCDGPTLPRPYAEQGTTWFRKLRLDIATMSVIPNDYTFSRSMAGGKNVPYGTGGDCFSLNPGGCRKGGFAVDFTGTSFRIREDVSWVHHGFPERIAMQDYNRYYSYSGAAQPCHYRE